MSTVKELLCLGFRLFRVSSVFHFYIVIVSINKTVKPLTVEIYMQLQLPVKNVFCLFVCSTCRYGFFEFPVWPKIFSFKATLARGCVSCTRVYYAFVYLYSTWLLIIFEYKLYSSTGPFHPCFYGNSWVVFPIYGWSCIFCFIYHRKMLIY